MQIQDLIILIGSGLFSVALLPSVFSRNKPAAWTSLLTAVVLSAFTWVYVTLDLTYGAITTATTAALWSILLVQRLRK